MVPDRIWIFWLFLFFLVACGQAEDDGDGKPESLVNGPYRVLTIYFAGTGNTVAGAFDTLGLEKYEEELLSILYDKDTSSESLKTPQSHYKFFVDGVGSHGCLANQADPLDTCILPTCCRGYSVCLNEAVAAFESVGGGNDLILNLVGFSRGGVLPMKMARWIYDNGYLVNRINILAYDPVPGLTFGDPVGVLGSDFVLPDIVNQYVGVYARDERSFRFEPIIPSYASAETKDMLVSVRGSHETLDGNQEIDGHSAVLLPVTVWMFLDDERLRNVFHIALGIAERLLSGPEWGEVTFIPPLFDADPKQQFLDYVDGMYAYPSFDYWMMHTVSFLGVLFSNYNIVYELLGRDHHLLIPHAFATHRGRLAYRSPYRHASEFIWWLPPFWWINPDQVYLLDHYVSPIDGEAAWARLEFLRGQAVEVDTEPPVPNAIELPLISGQCSVTLSSAPTATDNVDGTVIGTTTDPLSYTEQGSYTVAWTYTDQAGNSSTQTQDILVEDTTGPSIIVTAEPEVLWPPNHKLVEVNLSVEAQDNCGDVANVVLTSVTGSAPDDDRQHHGEDIQGADLGTEDYSILLRAERKGHEADRVYTVIYTVTDLVGNSATGSTAVTVPHDMGQHN